MGAMTEKGWGKGWPQVTGDGYAANTLLYFMNVFESTDLNQNMLRNAYCFIVKHLETLDDLQIPALLLPPVIQTFKVNVLTLSVVIDSTF